MKKHYVELELEIEMFDPANQIITAVSGTEQGGIGDHDTEIEF